MNRRSKSDIYYIINCSFVTWYSNQLLRNNGFTLKSLRDFKEVLPCQKYPKYQNVRSRLFDLFFFLYMDDTEKKRVDNEVRVTM